MKEKKKTEKKRKLQVLVVNVGFPEDFPPSPCGWRAEAFFFFRRSMDHNSSLLWVLPLNSVLSVNVIKFHFDNR